MATPSALRDSVRKRLGTMLLAGRLKPGSKLSLAELARDLDVSATPVREALTQLHHARVIDVIPNRGFFLRELDVQEAGEIYPVIAALEALAIRQSRFTPQDIRELRERHARFEAAGDPRSAVRFDLAFHGALTAHSANATLQRMIEDLKLRVFAYELGYMSSRVRAQPPHASHKDLIASLARNDVEQAAALAESHWRASLDYIRAQRA
jgi:DNA-binding GntR family transcriptional regulator